MRNTRRVLSLAFGFVFGCFCAADLAIAQSGAAQPSSPERSDPRARIYPNLAHIAFVVKDLDQAVHDAAARFGFDEAKVPPKTRVDVADALYRGKKVSFSADFCLVELGNTQLEFIQPVSGPSPYADALKGKASAVLHHAAFVVPSIDEQLARARQQNPALTVVLDAKLAQADLRYVYVDGVLPGILVEYIQYGRATPSR
jgi:catechol 2,3-dioxygenase-like lactoylglutathione lyase family enzyme